VLDLDAHTPSSDHHDHPRSNRPSSQTKVPISAGDGTLAEWASASPMTLAIAGKSNRSRTVCRPINARTPPSNAQEA